MALWRRLLAELLGSGFLAAVVVGSGIAAQRLSPAQTGLELLENAAATAAGLFAIILMFGPVSGGHFNPLVSFADAAFGGLRWRDAAAYLPVQVAGCIAGAVIANVMFAGLAVSVSAKDRSSPAHFLSEIVATRHHHRPDVLGYVRRDRPALRAGVHRGADHRGRAGRCDHPCPLPGHDRGRCGHRCVVSHQIPGRHGAALEPPAGVPEEVRPAAGTSRERQA